MGLHVNYYDMMQGWRTSCVVLKFGSFVTTIQKRKAPSEVRRPNCLGELRFYCTHATM